MAKVLPICATSSATEHRVMASVVSFIPPPTIVPLEVPEKYLKLETSDLKATVNPGEGNTIELKLEG